jgi:hypothetical protein
MNFQLSTISYTPSFFDLYSRYFVRISSTVGERGSFTICREKCKKIKLTCDELINALK